MFSLKTCKELISNLPLWFDFKLNGTKRDRKQACEFQKHKTKIEFELWFDFMIRFCTEQRRMNIHQNPRR